MTLELPTCANPDAPVVACVVCGQPVHTCELEEPVQIRGGINDYRCPVHPDGSQVGPGRWVCSSRCFETWQLVDDLERAIVDPSIGPADRDRLLQQTTQWRDEAPVLPAPPPRLAVVPCDGQ